MSRNVATIVVLLAVVGAVLSISLLSVHHGEKTALGGLCGEGESEKTGCDLVNESPYAQVLGIPWAVLGITFYFSMAFLLLFGMFAGEETLQGAGGLAFALFGAAVVADVVLLAIQAFAIHAFCTLCIVTYGVNLACAALLFPARRHVLALRRPEVVGRLALVAWFLATTVVFSWAQAIDDGKAARAELRQGTLLGVPAATRSEDERPKDHDHSEAPPVVAAPANVADGSAGSVGTDADRYRKEAERLQGILDDDVKLGQYMDDKAARLYLEAKVQRIDLAGVPVEGPPTAPVTVVEYSDFLCPHCRNLAGAIRRYLPNSGGRFRLYFKQHPLDDACNPKVKQSVHPGSCTLSLGALCANEQGKFWQYHDRVFESPPANPSRQDVENIARSLGLDAAAFGTCLAAPATSARLSKEIAEGIAVGVGGTPAIYINGKQLPRLNDFAQVLEEEAAKKGIPKSHP